MELSAILLARAVRRASIKAHPYFPDVVRELEKRFGFVKVPTTAAEILSPSDPLLFEHGKIDLPDRQILIQKLALYPQGVLAEVASNTEDADLVLDHFAKWSGFTQQGAEHDGHLVYVSQLEVIFKASLDAALNPFQSLAQMYSAFLGKYYGRPPTPHLGGLAFGIDPAEFPLGSDLRVERRANRPYAEAKYWSEAPLATRDHVALLQHLEEVLLTSAPSA